ncbi:MAG: hypothetical protein IJZ29_03765 [Clostridia bacterium]|nr:hypothetical protein [Clostridia bacterium]
MKHFLIIGFILLFCLGVLPEFFINETTTTNNGQSKKTIEINLQKEESKNAEINSNNSNAVLLPENSTKQVEKNESNSLNATLEVNEEREETKTANAPVNNEESQTQIDKKVNEYKVEEEKQEGKQEEKTCTDCVVGQTSMQDVPKNTDKNSDKQNGKLNKEEQKQIKKWIKQSDKFEEDRINEPMIEKDEIVNKSKQTSIIDKKKHSKNANISNEKLPIEDKMISEHKKEHAKKEVPGSNKIENLEEVVASEIEKQIEKVELLKIIDNATVVLQDGIVNVKVGN